MGGADRKVALELLVDHGNLYHQLVQALTNSRRRSKEVGRKGSDMLGLVNNKVGARPRGKCLDSCLQKKWLEEASERKTCRLTFLNESVLIEIKAPLLLRRLASL